MTASELRRFVQECGSRCGIGCEHDEAEIELERSCRGPDDTSPNMNTLELELATLPPLLNDPADLPDAVEGAPRYPLVTMPRDAMGLWALFLFWLALRRWRRSERKAGRL